MAARKLDGRVALVTGAAVTEFGVLDIIVNNAGYTWDSVIQKMSDEQFQAILDVHLIAPFRSRKRRTACISSARRSRTTSPAR